MVAAFGVEVDDLLERVEPLASIGSLRVEQEDVVAASGQLVTSMSSFLTSETTRVAGSEPFAPSPYENKSIEGR